MYVYIVVFKYIYMYLHNDSYHKHEAHKSREASVI